MTPIPLKASLLTVMLQMLAAAGLSAEETQKAAAAVKPLVTRDLAGIPGKEVVMLTVEYLPGGASLPHRHDANVFVYVLEGSMIMQVKGKEPVTLKPGDTFYEGPDDIHETSANASKTEPAKFLVFIVKDKGVPTTRSPQ
jgi:quercetin dioxygenase-like cupin family protein